MMSMLIKIVVPMIDFLLNWYVRIVRLRLAVPAVIEMSLFATIFFELAHHFGTTMASHRSDR
jgi:hypothetical protein